MNWTEALCQLYARRHPDAGKQEFDTIRKNEACLLQDTPPLLLYRRGLRAKAIRTDNTAPLVMSSLNISPDAIYIDDDFYTIVQTKLSLPQATSLHLQAKAPGGFSLLRRKAPLARWSVKGDLPEATTIQLTEIIQTIEPNYPHFYEILLFPHEDSTGEHTLLARTVKLPWALDGFSATSGYILSDENGQRIPSVDAALQCMERMTRIVVAVYGLLK